MIRIAIVAPIVLCVAAACAGSSTSTTTGHDPYPYTTPTPPFESTPADGVFARTVTPEVLGPAGGCRRCPPYRLALGDEILGLENGVFRIYHGGSGYMSVGHYQVEGSEITLFNDPNCPRDRGTYVLVDDGERRRFEPIDDPCAFDRVRQRFMTSLPWYRIDPPEGIFESPDGPVLMVLDERLSLWSGEVEMRGGVHIEGSTITIEAEGCSQEYEWSFEDRRLHLKVESQDCAAAWVDTLIETDWRTVG